MGFFSNRFNKEGPGIPKDAPKKKGLALFFQTLFRELWQIIKLNLLFILASIPIVTIGAAIAGMTNVTIKIVMDEPVFVWSDFWEGFRKNWKHGTLTFLIGAVIAASVGASLHLGLSGQKLFLVTGMLITFVSGLGTIYIYPMLVKVDVSYGSAIKNSLILSISCLQHSLPAFVAVALLLGGTFLYFPLTFPLVLLLVFSLSNYIASFAAWAGITKYVLKSSDSTEGSPESELGSYSQTFSDQFDEQHDDDKE